MMDWKQKRRAELDALEGFLAEWRIEDHGSELLCKARHRGRKTITLSARPSGWYVVCQGCLRGPYTLQDAMREGIEHYLASYLGFTSPKPTGDILGGLTPRVELN